MKEIAAKKPLNLDELRAVNGMGQQSAVHYEKPILGAVKEHMEKYGVKRRNMTQGTLPWGSQTTTGGSSQPSLGRSSSASGRGRISVGGSQTSVGGSQTSVGGSQTSAGGSRTSVGGSQRSLGPPFEASQSLMGFNGSQG